MSDTLRIYGLLLLPFTALSQAATFPTLGQLPSSAFSICGIDTFRQLVLPYGQGQKITLPDCGEVEVPNPYYYSFTCYSGGTLAMLIAPVFPEQDYNWELFDITGHDANDIFYFPALAVVGNWSGRYGRTGAGTNGLGYTQCVSLSSWFSGITIGIYGL